MYSVQDTEMETLAERMASITAASARVSDTLKERRKRTAELSATHSLLKKLQFLFELPSKLKECIGNEEYALGVKYYVRAQKVCSAVKCKLGQNKCCQT